MRMRIRTYTLGVSISSLYFSVSQVLLWFLMLVRYWFDAGTMQAMISMNSDFGPPMASSKLGISRLWLGIRS